MDARRLIPLTLAILALAAPGAAAAAPSLPAGYVPSPGGDATAYAPRTALTGGTTPPTGGTAPTYPEVSGSPAGGVSPGTAGPKPPPKPRRQRRRRARTKTHLGPGAKDVPRAYLRIYRAAARRHGVDWRVLAAIGKSESDHGRSTAPGVKSGLNFADCCAGPMQMCTVKSCGRVWQFYAVDADGDGRASVYDPPDAINAAAALVRDLQDVFGRSHPGLIMAAYNAGPSAVQRHEGVPPYPETRAYVSRGLHYIKALTAKRAPKRRR